MVVLLRAEDATRRDSGTGPEAVVVLEKNEGGQKEL